MDIVNMILKDIYWSIHADYMDKLKPEIQDVRTVCVDDTNTPCKICYAYGAPCRLCENDCAYCYPFANECDCCNATTMKTTTMTYAQFWDHM